ncbi:hypothetical protein K491DRAFT_718954 [Lophiostoma macrostomum CBS 122681]|uniref:Uncharacterized protein n=1 Tax=Lophiostoma macrostomum CBS 122681 TaxID=1314788 RepID=A0A6A6T0P6_9PLEO|nr:hypothetical protein K491DRAFT_718954 [Lophiostoma macrostomum CBS 122681]
MEGQSIDDMVTYAIGKLQGGLSREQVAANIREMLAAEKWPALAIEATLGQVETRLWEKERPKQPDSSAMVMELMQQMMNRMEVLEKRMHAPAPTTPTRAPTPPPAAIVSKKRFPDPEPFDGTRAKYQAWKYSC